MAPIVRVGMNILTYLVGKGGSVGIGTPRVQLKLAARSGASMPAV